MKNPTRSPWTLAGIGCAALVAAAVVAFCAFVYVGQRMARSVRAQQANPVLRRERVQELVQAREMPAGYAPALGLSVPFLGQVAVLERVDPATGVVFLLQRTGAADEEWSADVDRLLALRGLVLDPGEPIASGERTAGGAALAYRALRTQLGRGPARPSSPVLVALVDVRCPAAHAGSWLGVWIEPDPAVVGPIDPAALRGTPADPEAIAGFMSAFRLCP
jgi:hypothetical protein